MTSAPTERRGLLRALFVALITASLATAAKHAATTQETLLNHPAPQFSLSDLNGRPLSLERYRGKVVLLNFWATWCAPCLIEMPTFAAWQRQYGPQGLQVIGISMDDTAAPARHTVHRLNLNYPVAVGNARLGARYGGVLGLPLTFLIDRRGIIHARFQGETDLKLIEDGASALLAKP